MRKRTKHLLLAVSFAMLLTVALRVEAQDACPYPVYKSLACANSQGCKATRIVADCSGPRSSSKCQYGPLIIDCCGQELHFAEQAGPCDGNGGPLPALLKDLKNQPIAVQARVYVPSCRGSFEPAIPSSNAKGIHDR